MFFDGALVHGQSRCRTVVATSSAEEKCCSLAAGLQEALAARSILQELMRPLKLRSSVTPVQPKPWQTELVGFVRTKHVDVKYLGVQQVIQHRFSKVAPVSSNENLSDIGTKLVPGDLLQELCRNIRLSFVENQHQ